MEIGELKRLLDHIYTLKRSIALRQLEYKPKPPIGFNQLNEVAQDHSYSPLSAVVSNNISNELLTALNSLKFN